MPYLSRRDRARTFCCAIVLTTLFAGTCTPSIAPYSHIAYQYGVDLKVDSLRLMDAAEEEFSTHEDASNELRIELLKAYEFARGRPRNEHSTAQWGLMVDPEAHLLGGFLRIWEERGRLTRPFIAEAKQLISTAFDTIIQLESGKIKTAGDLEQELRP